ncbi:cupredoxin domain-containing protein [Neobacillus sp. MM2021_6]|uniref:cupredoxin domain-containing protein n=1 Tax=Bacillaceae TaxID=186817 RepID=UPI00140B063D|nr:MULTISPECIES: cupredoxin domain-containing protein [Bacillaceae]MBO0958471.1 cupredoxin domain-containing protein [Neobacillus sp. MM2021_6]NHC20711.1 cytochrome C oxidase subunit II [Bacillus sp. MM2020_4]WML41766.1 cupredoxin domain-containing protein [Neobacillus sp. OS1-2]
MKKILSLLLVTAALTLGLAACGGADEETAAKQDKTTETTTAATGGDFTITAKNWEFSSDKELVIKKGEKVKINLVNKEGVHSITNDELGINLTADKPAEFTADKTGEYELKCSTVCGATEDHEGMKISLKVID